MRQTFIKTVTCIICIVILQIAINFNTIYAENNIVIGTIPVLTGVDDTEIVQGEKFVPLDGVKADDIEDGDISEEIECIGTVGEEIGNYFIQYVVIDSHDNIVEHIRKVSVIEYKEPINTPETKDDVVSTPDAFIAESNNEANTFENIKEYIRLNKEAVIIPVTCALCLIMLAFILFTKDNKRKSLKKEKCNIPNDNSIEEIAKDNINIPADKNNATTLDDVFEDESQPIEHTSNDLVLDELITTNKEQANLNLDEVINSQTEDDLEHEYIKSLEGESILSFDEEKDPNALLDDMLDDIDNGSYNLYDEYIKCMRQASLEYENEIINSNEAVTDLFESLDKPEEPSQADENFIQNNNYTNLTEEDYVSYDDKMFEEIMSQEIVETHSDEQNELFDQIVKEVEKAKKGNKGFYYRKMVDGKIEEIFIEYDE